MPDEIEMFGGYPMERMDTVEEVMEALGVDIEESLFPELLAACRMSLRLLEDEGLDEKFDGEATILRDVIERAEVVEGGGGLT